MTLESSLLPSSLSLVDDSGSTISTPAFTTTIVSPTTPSDITPPSLRIKTSPSSLYHPVTPQSQSQQLAYHQYPYSGTYPTRDIYHGGFQQHQQQQQQQQHLAVSAPPQAFQSIPGSSSASSSTPSIFTGSPNHDFDPTAGLWSPDSSAGTGLRLVNTFQVSKSHHPDPLSFISTFDNNWAHHPHLQQSFAHPRVTSDGGNFLSLPRSYRAIDTNKRKGYLTERKESDVKGDTQPFKTTQPTLLPSQFVPEVPSQPPRQVSQSIQTPAPKPSRKRKASEAETSSNMGPDQKRQHVQGMPQFSSQYVAPQAVLHPETSHSTNGSHQPGMNAYDHAYAYGRIDSWPQTPYRSGMSSAPQTSMPLSESFGPPTTTFLSPPMQHGMPGSSYPPYTTQIQSSYSTPASFPLPNQVPSTRSVSQSESQRPKPRCFDHGCSGREFSTFSNLLRHQRERDGTATKSHCPQCGAEFTRTTAMQHHLAHSKCKSRQNPLE
ncbi:MAG: hypothetical protein M1831_006457 [Alyxoria varia]|nr:MAG: hypothetical protein M1831_006457 [Alyxoria varia]